MNRGSFRLNLDRNVSRKFRIGTRLGLSRSHAHVLPNGGAASVILDALTAPPTLPVKVTGGEYFNGTDPLTGRTFTNPVATAVAITHGERGSTAQIAGSSRSCRSEGFGVHGLNTGKTFLSGSTAGPHSSLLSYFSRVCCTIAGKYLFTASGRVDGSSKFGAGHRYGFFT